MAPDINSMPSSPRQGRPQTTVQSPSGSTSRRASQQMPPPPVPSATLQQSQRSPVMANSEPAGLPMRHPRPLTAAELYAECEKEQEAVVNRLTRELTALRAQSASVASNASHSSTSTSASLLPVDIGDPNPAHQLTGATHPTPSRRHRSSSSLSTRSIPNTPSTSSAANAHAQAQHGNATNVPAGGVSQASADRAASRRGTGNLSRQPSVSASGNSTPARQSLDGVRHNLPMSGSYTLPHRPSVSREPSYISSSSTAAHAGTPVPPISPTQNFTTPHYADTAAYRSEMEIVKAENEALRQRVRGLERALRARRRDSSNSDAAASAEISNLRQPRDGSAALSPAVASPESGRSAGVAAWATTDGGVGGVAPPRERSESQSTTASSRRGLPAEDDVRVGESAAGASNLSTAR